jgi:hypothetical protein
MGSCKGTQGSVNQNSELMTEYGRKDTLSFESKKSPFILKINITASEFIFGYLVLRHFNSFVRQTPSAFCLRVALWVLSRCYDDQRCTRSVRLLRAVRIGLSSANLDDRRRRITRMT